MTTITTKLSRGRDARVLAEGECFKNSSQSWPKPCNSHTPTLDELRTISFSDYVRHVVLKKAEEHAADGDVSEEEDDSESHHEQDSTQVQVSSPAANPTSRPVANPHNTRKRKEYRNTTPIPDLIKAAPTKYIQGMAKVTLPEGIIDLSQIGNDQTGRGPQWGEGTHLGDMKIPSPIKQCVRGIGGIYEYTFLDLPETNVVEFRKKADEYMSEQVGSRVFSSLDYKEKDMELLERKFWKRLGPTMQPAMYGADMEGSLCGPTNCHGWNISRLESCLQLLLSDYQFHGDTQSSQDSTDNPGIPGVTTPYLYFGMWASVFCAHTEDMNLLSINYLHAGAPKVWYAVAPGEPARRMEQFCEGHFHASKTACAQYMRHKRCLLSPHILKKAGIPFTRTIQYPGDTMITFPGGYHFGFNAGFNVAEATNFAVPEWVPYGKLAGICMCRPDSVRVDMSKFSRILLEYDADLKSEDSKRLKWKEWSYRIAKESLASQQSKSAQLRQDKLKEAPPLGKPSKQEAKKEFWIEVMPLPSGKKASKKKRKGKPDEIWHLAKPLPRKATRSSTRILCIVPVESVDKVADESVFNEEVNEQCFRGYISEVSGQHIRVHLDGFQKKDDVWLPMGSPKLHLDGGPWAETKDDGELPKLHFWKEEDSKRRCS